MEAKPNTPCLSQLALGRLASGQRAPLAAEAEHLRSCLTCRALLDDEAARAHAAAQEPLPTAVTALAPSGRAPKPDAASVSRISHWQHGIVAVLAIIGVGLMAQRMVGVPAATTNAPVAYAEWAVQVSGAVKDAHGQVRLLDDLGHLGRLRAGDSLQVHVQAFDTASATLADAHGHTVYFAGEVPEGGWLPVGIEVTPQKSLHLTLQVCTKTPVTPCQTWELQ